MQPGKSDPDSLARVPARLRSFVGGAALVVAGFLWGGCSAPLAKSDACSPQCATSGGTSGTATAGGTSGAG